MPWIADREAADPVASGAMKSARHMLAPARALLDLLAQEGQARDLLVASSSSSDDVVALAPARPEADHALRGQPLLARRSGRASLRVGEQLARAFADHLVVEDRRDSCRPAPRRGRTASSRCVRAGRAAASRRTRAAPGCAGARAWPAMSALKPLARASVEARSSLCPLPRARFAQRLVFVGDLGRRNRRAGSSRRPGRRDADRAAGVEHMDTGPL